MIWLLGLAAAGPVQCGALDAAHLLAEARVQEAGAPQTHPWLVPGLAMASTRSEAALQAALTELCAPGGELSVTPTDHWETAGWSAHTLRLTRSESLGCVLFERSILVTVGSEPGAAPRYSLQANLPLSQTPVGDCPEGPRWREERPLDPGDGPVRLVLSVVWEDERPTQSEVLVRKATPEGWKQQVLQEPAPQRLLGGFAGPEWTLAGPTGEPIVVASGDRRGDPSTCTAVGGQRVWTWEGGSWEGHDSDVSRTLLAERGLWRLAGDPGWMVILAQDTEDDREILESRQRRLQRGNPDPLSILESARFPELNAGYLIVTPPPFPDQASAEAARTEWGRRGASYVKRAWPPPDPCTP